MSTTVVTSSPSRGIIMDPSRQLTDGYLDRTPVFQYILLSICFPMWGAAASLNDILITQFKSVFTLSDFASAFVQSAFYGGYFVLAIPASRVIRRWSYKTGILTGLTFYIVGCTMFFPASRVATYSVFLAAIFAIAVGLSFLETSCNTYSSMIGPKRLATLRLNISQTFYPIGSIAGILLGKYLIFTEGEALHAQLKGLSEAEAHELSQQMLLRTLQPYRFLVLVLLVLLVVVALLGCVVGMSAWDRLLTARAGSRQRRVEAAVPDASELLALAVGAGESVPAALDRVASLSHSDLGDELARAVADIRLGAPSVRALTDLAARNDSPALSRLCQTLSTAIGRGSPLAAVLHDQARDIREASRQRLMEEGGKREIAMLFPVVFLILPVTVLFALYPGLMALDITP